MIDESFIRSGRAIFTISNGKGDHFTYRVNRKEDRSKEGNYVYFASLLTGPNNLTDYTYMGLLHSHCLAFRITQGSKVKEDAQSVKVFRWMLRILDCKTTLPEGYKIQHEGRCGRCAKTLTDPLSIEIGIGPHCRKEMGIEV